MKPLGIGSHLPNNHWDMRRVLQQGRTANGQECLDSNRAG